MGEIAHSTESSAQGNNDDALVNLLNESYIGLFYLLYVLATIVFLITTNSIVLTSIGFLFITKI